MHFSTLENCKLNIDLLVGDNKTFEDTTVGFRKFLWTFSVFSDILQIKLIDNYKTQSSDQLINKINVTYMQLILLLFLTVSVYALVQCTLHFKPWNNANRSLSSLSCEFWRTCSTTAACRLRLKCVSLKFVVVAHCTVLSCPEAKDAWNHS